MSFSVMYISEEEVISDAAKTLLFRFLNIASINIDKYLILDHVSELQNVTAVIMIHTTQVSSYQFKIATQSISKQEHGETRSSHSSLLLQIK